jgi:20S proteasome subunit alpha 4/ATP-dependent RNA helicase DDX56/DBP9
LRALLELVEPSSKNIEIAVVTPGGTTTLTNENVDALIKKVEEEKQAAEQEKKDKARQRAEDALAAAGGN